jgi:hypothetical protein
LDHIRSLLEQWIFSILSRIDTFPFDLQIHIENFFHLPDGPNYKSRGSGGGENEGSVGGPCGDDDDESQTESEDPSVTSEGQSSSSSFEKGKKKKRLVKGFKKRVTKLFKGQSPSKPTPPPSERDDRDTMSDIRDSLSTVTSDTSLPYPFPHGNNSEKHLIQSSKLLTSRVQRGGERSKGLFIYEVSLSSLDLFMSLSLSLSLPLDSTSNPIREEVAPLQSHLLRVLNPLRSNHDCQWSDHWLHLPSISRKRVPGTEAHRETTC